MHCFRPRIYSRDDGDLLDMMEFTAPRTSARKYTGVQHFSGTVGDTVDGDREDFLGLSLRSKYIGPSGHAVDPCGFIPEVWGQVVCRGDTLKYPTHPIGITAGGVLCAGDSRPLDSSGVLVAGDTTKAAAAIVLGGVLVAGDSVPPTASIVLCGALVAGDCVAPTAAIVTAGVLVAGDDATNGGIVDGGVFVSGDPVSPGVPSITAGVLVAGDSVVFEPEPPEPGTTECGVLVAGDSVPPAASIVLCGVLVAGDCVTPAAAITVTAGVLVAGDCTLFEGAPVEDGVFVSGDPVSPGVPSITAGVLVAGDIDVFWLDPPETGTTQSGVLVAGDSTTGGGGTGTLGCGGVSWATRGSILWEDTFTDADGTLLGAHVPDTSPGGAGYTATAFDIQSGTVECGGSLSSTVLDCGSTSSTFSVVFRTDNITLVNDFAVRPRGPAGPYCYVDPAEGYLVVTDPADPAVVCSIGVEFANDTDYTLEVQNTPTTIIATCNGATVSIRTDVNGTSTTWQIDGGLFGRVVMKPNLQVTSP